MLFGGMTNSSLLTEPCVADAVGVQVKPCCITPSQVSLGMQHACACDVLHAFVRQHII
jgi:hypothetical protein